MGNGLSRLGGTSQAMGKAGKARKAGRAGKEVKSEK